MTASWTGNSVLRRTVLSEVLIATCVVALGQAPTKPPLCSAAWIDIPQIARILLEAGADPNGRKDELCPPIVMTHSVAVLRVLLKAHVDIEAACNGGQRLLHGACDAANEGIVALLLAHKAQIKSVDTSGSTPLMYLGDPAGWPNAESARIRIAKRLIQEGANIGAKNKIGLAAFDVAKEHGLARLAKFFGTGFARSLSLITKLSALPLESAFRGNQT